MASLQGCRFGYCLPGLPGHRSFPQAAPSPLTSDRCGPDLRHVLEIQPQPCARVRQGRGILRDPTVYRNGDYRGHRRHLISLSLRLTPGNIHTSLYMTRDACNIEKTLSSKLDYIPSTWKRRLAYFLDTTSATPATVTSQRLA